MKPKKLSIEAFHNKELSTEEMKKIMAGSGETISQTGYTKCVGTDVDRLLADSDA